MPNIEEHCSHTKMRYGVTGESVHRWIDEPVRLVGPTHREYRHVLNQEIPAFLVEEYGRDLARNIMLDHLTLDKESTIAKINNKRRNTLRKPKQTTIHEEELRRALEEKDKEIVNLKNGFKYKIDKMAQDYIDQLSRDRPDPLREARMFQDYLDAGLTQEQIVEKLGLSSRSYLTDRIMLLKLSPLVQDILTNLHGMLEARIREKVINKTEEELQTIMEKTFDQSKLDLAHLRPISTLPENDQALLVSALIDTFAEGGTVSKRQVEAMVRDVKQRNEKLNSFNAAWLSAITKKCPECSSPPLLGSWDEEHHTFSDNKGHQWRYDLIS